MFALLRSMNWKHVVNKILTVDLLATTQHAQRTAEPLLKRACIAAMLMCASVAHVGAADDPPQFEFMVPPGKVKEVCRSFDPGRVRFTFSAGAPLAFNVHYHVGDKVIEPVKADAAVQFTGVIDIAKRETYCLMWTNRQREPVRVAGEFVAEK